MKIEKHGITLEVGAIISTKMYSEIMLRSQCKVKYHKLILLILTKMHIFNVFSHLARPSLNVLCINGSNLID